MLAAGRQGIKSLLFDVPSADVNWRRVQESARDFCAALDAESVSYTGSHFYSDAPIIRAVRVADAPTVVCVASEVRLWGRSNHRLKIVHANSVPNRKRSLIDLGDLIADTARGVLLIAVLFVDEDVEPALSAVTDAGDQESEFVVIVLPRDRPEASEAAARFLSQMASVFRHECVNAPPSASAVGALMVAALSGYPQVSQRVRLRAGTADPGDTPNLVWSEIEAPFYSGNAARAGEAVEELAWENRYGDIRRQTIARHLLIRLLNASEDETLRRTILAELSGKGVSTERSHPCLLNPEEFQFREVPGGPCSIGATLMPDRADYPMHSLQIAPYRIARFPVTVGQFSHFGGDSAFAFDPYCRPADQVDWHSASGFCRWLDATWRRQGYLSPDEEVRLPTEAEWEKAARGLDGRSYPWGDAHPTEETCNCDGLGPGRTTPVGAYIGRGTSPYGCEDMSGNVFEWTNSLWGMSSRVAEFRYPYEANDGRERPAADIVRRVVRGGAFYFRPDCVCTYVRNPKMPAATQLGSGFRIVIGPALGGQS